MTSEQGLLALAGRREALPLREALALFRDLVSADIDRADSRKAYFRRRATLSKTLSLALTALSTVVLGIQQIPLNATPEPSPRRDRLPSRHTDADETTH